MEKNELIYWISYAFLGLVFYIPIIYFQKKGMTKKRYIIIPAVLFSVIISLGACLFLLHSGFYDTLIIVALISLFGFSQIYAILNIREKVIEFRKKRK